MNIEVLNSMNNSNVSVFKDKKSNIIYLSYYIFDEKKQANVRKKKSTKLEYTAKNLKYVEEKIIPSLFALKEQGKGILAHNRVNVENVEVFVEELIKELEKDKVSRRAYTTQDYKRSLELYFLKYFKNYKIRDITADKVQNFFLDLNTLTGKRKANLRVPINMLFKKAIRMGIISENPLDAVDNNLFRDKRTKETHHLSLGYKKQLIEEDNAIDPFNEAEIKLILKTAEGKAKNFFGLLFFTGMRPSELIYLEWKNVDLENKFIVIEGAITGKQTKEEETKTKTYSSHRVVLLSDVAVSYFQEQAKKTLKFKSKVFLNQYNKPYTSHAIFRDNYWKKLFDMGRKQVENGIERKTERKANGLNIRYRELYNLRHSFASINLSLNRLPLLLISKQLGHSSAEVTLKKYSAFVAEDDSIILNLLNKSAESFL